MKLWKANTELFVIAALVAAGLISIYQTLFCLWMVAHPVYASPEWHTRLAIRSSTTVALGVLLTVLLARRYRRRHPAGS